MELIITLIVLIIIWCIAFMVGNKQGANRIVNQIKKDGGYYDMEYTSSAYPILYPTSSVNNDTMGTIGSKTFANKLLICNNHDFILSISKLFGF